MLKKKDLIYMTLIGILFYLVISQRKTKEDMTNVNPGPYTNKVEKLLEMVKNYVTQEINKIYKADVESIRNLSLIASKLQTSNGENLIIPSNVIIRGDLKIDKNLNVKGKQDIGESASFGSNYGRRLIIQPSNYKNEQTYLSFYQGSKRIGYILPKIDGQIDIKGSVNVKDSAAVQGNFYVNSNLGNVLLKDSNINVNNVNAKNLNVSNVINSKYINSNNTILAQNLNVKNNTRLCTSTKKPIVVSGINVEDGETSRLEFYNGEERCGNIYGNSINKKLIIDNN